MTPMHEIKFDWRSYNCGHFTREVWMELTGVDLGLRMPDVISRETLMNAFADGERELVGKVIHEIPAPEDPCLVLLSPGPRCVPHCGVFCYGALLHLPKGGKVTHQKLESVIEQGSFKSVRFFR